MLRSELVLASASPRRKELLTLARLTFRVLVSKVEEKALPREEPQDYVVRNAILKASDISKQCGDALVIGADTIVVSPDGVLMEKPADEEDSVRMLKALSGRTHTVYTAFAIVTRGGQEILHSERC